MGIKTDITSSELKARFAELGRYITEELERTFAYTGEEAKRKIRDRSHSDSWIDRTGNLRSSIGYSVLDHGKKVIESAFDIVGQGAEGASKGRQAINDLTTKYSEVYALLVVAGMEYADFVEAIEGKDVLESTRLWANGVIGKRIEKALDRAEKRFEKLFK